MKKSFITSGPGTNLPAQLQRLARILSFQIEKIVIWEAHGIAQ